VQINISDGTLSSDRETLTAEQGSETQQHYTSLRSGGRCNTNCDAKRRFQLATVGSDPSPSFTCPRAAVQFDSHANRFRMSAVRHESYSSSDDGRVDFAQLCDVSVDVTLKNLKKANKKTNA
jgi:hypothetical protein